MEHVMKKVRPLPTPALPRWLRVAGAYASRRWKIYRDTQRLHALNDYMLRDIGLERHMIDAAVRRRWREM